MARVDMTQAMAEALVAKAVAQVEAEEAYEAYEAFNITEWRRARAERARHDRAMHETIRGIEFRMS